MDAWLQVNQQVPHIPPHISESGGLCHFGDLYLILCSIGWGVWWVSRVLPLAWSKEKGPELIHMLRP